MNVGSSDTSDGVGTPRVVKELVTELAGVPAVIRPGPKRGTTHFIAAQEACNLTAALAVSEPCALDGTHPL